MRYSKLFGRTVRSEPSDYKFASHKLLYKGGFIRESVAGRYYFLPLGMKVIDKITNIIEEEMDKTGAQKMLSPVLHPIELWRETNRTAETGYELMKIRDRRGSEFALGGTAEEMFVDVVRKFKLSHKDLPFNIYQFSTKFRDELRARGGLLRMREFTMKDAYSFDKDEQSFRKTYKLMADTYTKIFKRMGLQTRMVEADNGYIGGEYCHEFVVDSSIGESRYFTAKNYAAHEDVAKFKRKEINFYENIEELKIVEQPEWVQTMDEFSKHYGMEKDRFLKNVVYRNTSNKEIIIAVIRGDLDVNINKLEHVVKAVGQLKEADTNDLKEIGTKAGYVHSWGHHGVRYIGDLSLETVHNFRGGQKEAKSDSINVNYGRDFRCEKIADIALAKQGYVYNGNGKLQEKRGIEVGNIFQLGHHYTNLMKGATFANEKGEQKQYYMGCYGIGLGRSMAAVVEVHHDDKGIIWPTSLTPYHVHLISLERTEKLAKNLSDKIEKKGWDVLWDDRNESAGVKFSDADLIGIPIRLVVSQATGKKVEWKERSAGQIELRSGDEVLRRLERKYSLT